MLLQHSIKRGNIFCSRSIKKNSRKPRPRFFGKGEKRRKPRRGFLWKLSEEGRSLSFLRKQEGGRFNRQKLLEINVLLSARRDFFLHFFSTITLLRERFFFAFFLTITLLQERFFSHFSKMLLFLMHYPINPF